MHRLNVQNSQHTLLKHARTLGTPSLGPSIPGMKSILGPIQLKGLTMVNSRPFSAPSAINIKKVSQGSYTTNTNLRVRYDEWLTNHKSASQSVASHMHRTISASQ
ncbi:hypothetical protein TorRG33x02_342330 [Trema orientale]|uniref:Uncharacterized protein n=1 Tax=Trema orientale TaxID=63057 RepID=A0A2P5ASS3_TREOI|nr:hypothetical protein TorRG33x02_342330 [Trema orientale]